MSQREKDIQYVKNHVGEAFKSGKKIVFRGNHRYAVVELIDGREVKISLPTHKGEYNG